MADDKMKPEDMVPQADQQGGAVRIGIRVQSLA